MKFSEFIYNIVKAASDYGDDSMSYQSFLLGNMSKDEDYSKFLDKAFLQTNAFIKRLAVLDKLPYKNYTCDYPEDKKLNLPSDCKTVVTVIELLSDGAYINHAFKQTRKELLVLGTPSSNELLIQYKQVIPTFKKSDIHFIEEFSDEENNSSYSVEGGDIYEDIYYALEAADLLQLDLTEEYGIEDEALYIGIDWCVGRLNEDASRGHSQEMEAETRLNDLIEDPFIFNQKRSGGNRL